MRIKIWCLLCYKIAKNLFRYEKKVSFFLFFYFGLQKKSDDRPGLLFLIERKRVGRTRRGKRVVLSISPCFRKVAFEQPFGILSVEEQGLDIRVFVEESVDGVWRLVTDVAVQASFAFASPAYIPQGDARIEQHGGFSGVGCRKLAAAYSGDDWPKGIAGMSVILLLAQRLHTGYGT